MLLLAFRTLFPGKKVRKVKSNVLPMQKRTQKSKFENWPWFPLLFLFMFRTYCSCLVALFCLGKTVRKARSNVLPMPVLRTKNGPLVVVMYPKRSLKWPLEARMLNSTFCTPAPCANKTIVPAVCFANKTIVPAVCFANKTIVPAVCFASWPCPVIFVQCDNLHPTLFVQ